MRRYDLRYALKIIETLFKAGRNISLGYGMHFGWAVEGAIGSSMKIDASYLSPHVNTAARLEAATKQFQTMFLLSHDFVKQLSPRNQRLCRKIDCVVLVGKKEPTPLYCWDMWLGKPAEQGTAACHELSPLSVLNPPDSTDKKGDSPLGSFDSSIMNGTIYAGLFGTAVAAYEVSPLAACTIASTIAKNSRFSADCLPVRPPRINPCMSP